MKNLSDEELVGSLIKDCIGLHLINPPLSILSKRAELISRLNRGRKAIEIMEILIHITGFDVDDIERAKTIKDVITEYQQSEEVEG